ncbi:ATP-dependent RecD-like DNA helicase [Thermoflavimicrobium daqui]|uniref:ATP-dependent RecD2 DNA helicase n=1 Tax=Thermoflavimicrobium daqui TaxID=2137476 RepID=A0A364K621_9BACL|nr:ATP-dependent RecD-like DNA helicase [Thermoflavimicrobium daqui]RAL25759.1 ATP-dependent RecD-like DNA helicase [Thermoflavimicrobium daqui]
MTQTQLELFTESYIKGTFIQEIFYNEENGYGVYLLKIMETSLSLDEESIIIVGQFLRPHLEDEIYTCYGELRKHPRFGQQYYVHQVKKELPRSEEAIVKYLSSDLFPGIGKKTAKRIVEQLGIDALDRILVNPDILMEIKGISASRAQEIAGYLQEHHALEQAMVFLYHLGLGPALALKIVQIYKHETISVIKNNPYRLVDEVEGIGFRRADELARQQGLVEDSPARFRAAVLYVLHVASQSEGHVYLAKEELLKRVDSLTGEGIFPEEAYQENLQAMILEEKIFVEDENYYLPSLFYAEVGMARRVKDLLDQELDQTFPVAEIYRVIGEIEEEWQVSYADRQREAMITALASPLMILTGGPGTGKTTVIKGICQTYARLHECSIDPKDYDGSEDSFPIRLVAPTGRAAKRMSEATGLPAMTIHRLLGWKRDFFEHDAKNPITGSLLIVDEVSMLDIWLANQLFRAIPKGMQVILVGDQDQLPSVGPGKLLYHLLQVQAIPRVELSEIFRQSEGSSIIRLAHAIKKGEVPDDLLERFPDRRFFTCKRDQALAIVLQTYVSAIKRGYTLFDVQVLAPIYKGPVGVDRINQEIQQAINPADSSKKELSWGEFTFRLGDKVLQLVNHPEHPVYNGDMGMITAIDEKAGPEQPALWVLYDQQLEVPYKRSQLNQIALAYACSVHKGQGSEFAIVIFPILQAYRRMLERNLIYTGITRSKSYLILCGEQESFREGIKQQRGEDRNSRLKDLIEEEW